MVTPVNQSRLRELARVLLREPFATQYGLAEETLDSASQRLEGEPPSESPTVTESFEKCKAIFCTLLLELEGSPTDLSNQKLGDLAETARGPKKEEKTPPPVPKTPSGTRFTHPLGVEYFALFESLSVWNGGEKPRFSKTLLLRLSAQQLCFALELEAQAKLAPGLGTFGSGREEMILKILVRREHHLDFSDEINKIFEKLEKEHAAFLPNGKVPSLSMLNALKYLGSLDSLEGFRPSLMESGTLLFFFGRSQPTESPLISNLLHTTGVSPTKILELALRLGRVQKARGMLFDPSAAFEASQEAIFREDIRECLEIMHTLHTGAQMPLKKAG